MLKFFILYLCISIGSAIGWQCGSPGGLMGSYLVAVFGATLGLFIGRRLQRNLDGD